MWLIGFARCLQSLDINILSLVRICGLGLCLTGMVFAQGQLPYMNGGPNSVFAQFDFAQLALDQQNTPLSGQKSIQAKDLAESPSVSFLDMAAPKKAVEEFDHAQSYLRAQNSKAAIPCLRKAVSIYPEFVSAHNVLGLAYLEQQDGRAKDEFETAAKLDDHYPITFLNLGMLALGANDFASADSSLEKAAFLSPNDPRILTAWAFAQNGNHKYAESLRTAQRVHALDHRGMANVHYIAAAAAISLNDRDTMQRELSTLLQEDPTNPLAPVARKHLDLLASPAAQPVQPSQSGSIEVVGQPNFTDYQAQTFPNNDHLHAELSAMEASSEPESCDDCEDAPAFPAINARPASHGPAVENWPNLFTIHRAVDETALFFSVSENGHPVNNLSISDLQIRDDNQPPDRILQFLSQAELPLRLGVLIDTSDSTERRLLFEKQAAAHFLGNVLHTPSDLAFVSGFSSEVSVSQDFSSDSELLSRGIEQLKTGGGTALFDAIYFASWKLAAYPEQDRVAKVLLILTDGEDNSSHRSLKQTIEEAEAAGITIYTVSTAESPRAESDADKVLRTLAERSGGAAFFPGSLRGLEQNLAKLRDVIRNRYFIAYKAANFNPNGKYRNIQLRAEKDGKRLNVHVRKGYYARMAMNQF